MGPRGGLVAAARRFAKGGALALALAVAACGETGLDALPSAGVARVADVEADGALRLSDGRRVALAGVRVDDPAVLERWRGREVELLGDPALAQVRARRGRWLQGELVERGLARVETGAGARTLAEPLLRREAQARRERRGGWAGRWRVLTADEALDARGFQIVEGRVRRAGRFRSGVFLDFGANWRRDLSARVASEALDDFAAAGKAPLMLEGRAVRVRGELISTRNGPLLVLDHPEALELLAE